MLVYNITCLCLHSCLLFYSLITHHDSLVRDLQLFILLFDVMVAFFYVCVNCFVVADIKNVFVGFEKAGNRE